MNFVNCYIKTEEIRRKTLLINIWSLYCSRNEIRRKIYLSDGDLDLARKRETKIVKVSPDKYWVKTKWN